jgi:hypothetical protein
MQAYLQRNYTNVGKLGPNGLAKPFTQIREVPVSFVLIKRSVLYLVIVVFVSAMSRFSPPFTRINLVLRYLPQTYCQNSHVLYVLENCIGLKCFKIRHHVRWVHEAHHNTLLLLSPLFPILSISTTW